MFQFYLIGVIAVGFIYGMGAELRKEKEVNLNTILAVLLWPIVLSISLGKWVGGWRCLK